MSGQSATRSVVVLLLRVLVSLGLTTRSLPASWVHTPYAVGPSMVLLIVSAAVFVVSILEARDT